MAATMSSRASTNTIIQRRTSHMARLPSTAEVGSSPGYVGDPWCRDSTASLNAHSPSRTSMPGPPRIGSVTLRLLDSRTGQKLPFEPIGDGPVGLYVCGVTPYDTGHLGHAFTYVSFDVLHRYLEYLGYQVTYVQNLTDVDDDILRKAREPGEDYVELGNRHLTTFLAEMAALNWLPPDHLTRATKHIPQMQELIRQLVAS